MRPDLPPPPSPEWPALTTSELVARKPDAETFARLPRAPISVVLEDVRSLANVGLIFRICDALRVERLYLCGITGRPADPNPENDARPRHVQDRAEREITKTAVMAIPFVPWEYQPSALDVVKKLKLNGYQIVAVEQAHHSTPYTRAGIYRPPPDFRPRARRHHPVGAGRRRPVRRAAGIRHGQLAERGDGLRVGRLRDHPPARCV